MEPSINKELERIMLISKYNTKNTLSENYKKILIIESSIASFIDDILKAVVRKEASTVGSSSDSFLKFGDKSYKLNYGAGRYGTPTLDADGVKYSELKIGGVDVPVNDLIKIADGNISQLSNATKTNLLRNIINEGASNTELRNILRKQANDILTNSTDGVYKNSKDLQKVIKEMNKKFKQGVDTDEIIKTYVSATFRSLDDEEKLFVERYFFGPRKPKIEMDPSYKSIGKKISGFFRLRQAMPDIYRAIKQFKFINVEEKFIKKVESRFNSFFDDYTNAFESGVDEYKLNILYKRFSKELDELVDENTFIREWGQDWILAQKQGCEDVIRIIEEQMAKNGASQTEIKEIIEKIKSDKIEDIFSKAKALEESAEDADIKTWFDTIQNKINDLIGNSEYPGPQIWVTWKNNAGPFFNKANVLIGKIGQFIGNSFTKNRNKTFMALNFGIFRNPSQIARMFTRYGKGFVPIALSSIQSYLELMALKIFIGPLISTTVFWLLGRIEKLFKWFGWGVDLVDNTKKSTVDKFKEEYGLWFSGEGFKQMEGWLPFKFHGPVFELEKKAVNYGVGVISGTFTEEGEDQKENERIREEKKLQEMLEAQNKFAGNKAFEKEYTQKFENEFFLVKYQLENFVSEVKIKNGYSDSDIEKLIKNLKLQVCPNFDEKKLKELEKGRLINRIRIIKNDTYCAGILIGDNVYEVKEEFNQHFYIDDEGKQQPLKNIIQYIDNPEKMNQKSEKEIKQKSEITPTTDQQKPVDANRLEVEPKPTVTPAQNKQTVTPAQNKPTVTPVQEPVIDRNKSKGDLRENVMINLIKKLILEEEEEKTLKMKDWDEIFTFQKIDDKNPGKYTDVKIKMESVMDRMPHWRKKYKKLCDELENCDDDGEDDSFVRAVIDTHPEVVRILFTKGLAHLTSSEEQEDLNEGLHGLLAIIREAKSVEVEVWSVYRHPSSPDKIWSLVKGDFKPKELSSMDVKMQRSPGNTEEKKKDSLSELKKKESDAIELLSKDEKKGLSELPIKVKNKIKEKISKGWTTEEPPKELKKFYKEDNVNTVFADDITIYKLRPNESFFDFIKDKDLSNNIKRGFCRAIYYVEKEFDLPKEKMEKINEILDECEEKLDGKYGQNYL
jgi:hypothetical protein